MLAAVVDRTGRGGTDKVRALFEQVERRLAAHGLRLERPVNAEIIRIPIMGATTSKADRHILHISEGAVRSNLLDGLIAHEMGHMLLTEAGHPSHDPDVLESLRRGLRLPRGGHRVFAQAFNHVQDIYADDLAFLTGLEDRAYGFFAEWIRGNATQRGDGRWPNVGLSMSNGFALGNLGRHGLLLENDALWTVAREFDREVGLESVVSFATFFEGLPRRVDRERFVERARTLVALLDEAAADGGKARTF